MKSPFARSSICASTGVLVSRLSAKFSQVTTLAPFVSVAAHSRERYGTADIGAPTATISALVSPSANRTLPHENAQSEEYSFVPNGNNQLPKSNGFTSS